MNIAEVLKIVAFALFVVAAVLRKDLVAAGLACWVAAEVF